MKKSSTRIALALTLTLLFADCSVAIAQKLPDLIPFKDQDLYGYCDSNMQVIIKAQYRIARPFFEDRAHVEKDDLNGFIDSKGNQVIPMIYLHAESFSNGSAKVMTAAREWKYINRKGEFISKPEEKSDSPMVDMGRTRSSEGPMGPIKEDRYFFRGKNNTEGYMTVDGDTISSSEYTYPYYSESYSTSDNYDQTFRHFYESRAIVSGKKGQGYIDLNGKLVIDTVFDVAFNFKEGRAKVKLNGKYGFIDKQGKIIGEIKYDQASYFYNGMAQVVVGETCGYINLEGEEIIPLIYDFWQGENYTSFHEGLVRVRINEKFGLLDKQGKVIAPVKYDDIQPFSNQRAFIRFNDKIGVIDEKGNEVIQPNYERLNWLDQFTFIYQINREERIYGLINLQGTLLIDAVDNRPTEGPSPGLYTIRSSADGYYFIDKYGTKYLKK